ncbi:alpha/beta hydrolase [Hydrogenophaga sp. PAMC20947]|uniref:alpha/beta fold hydrolase n=1 Tax=Hydrogenophaga sp. PAMC20947 TaxID=2565558 RepID=UPI00109DDD97|nr:alpha/beta hydrolase [Hydrogenophaga sp. PAMC20947]QCB48141.1 alpha/beta hydrolase [Hydrogenophaga sp. PAMC20947]
MSTWVLLRGLTREAAHWGAFPTILAEVLPEDRMVMLDLPGNGTLHDQASPASVGEMAQACRRALRSQGFAPPYHLLAMSLGAMVATEWAHQAPAEVAGCVLVNTSFRPFSPFYRRLRPGNYPALLCLTTGARDPWVAEALVWRLTSQQTPPNAEVLAQWVAARVVHPVARGNAIRQLVAAARYRAPITAPAARTLLLASAQDTLVHSGCSDAIAQAWGCPLVLHPTAGHDLPLDDPAWVARQVGAWVAGGGAGQL